MKKTIYFIICFSCASIMLSCVSTKKYQALEDANNEIQKKYNNLFVQADEQLSVIKKLNSEKDRLSAELEQLRQEQENLLKQSRERAALQEKFKNTSKKEMEDLLRKIQENEESLQKKEDELKERNKRLIEVETALNKNEENIKLLRKKVSDALLGFEGKDLTVHIKNGKVYVSMEEKLLFRSGSYNLEKAGIQALNEISKVLAQNQDINIMIEGHTDNVRYAGSGQLNDNWDLSVKRATTVARQLIKNASIKPNRITAAGRREFIPLVSNDTKEGRQKNRRTEIILSPKLDELLEVLQTN